MCDVAARSSEVATVDQLCRAGATVGAGQLAPGRSTAGAVGTGVPAGHRRALLAMACWSRSAVGLGHLGPVVSLVTRPTEPQRRAAARTPKVSSPRSRGRGDALARTAILQRAVEMTEDFAERQGFLTKVEQRWSGRTCRCGPPRRCSSTPRGRARHASLAFIPRRNLRPGLLSAVLAALCPPAIVNFLGAKRQQEVPGPAARHAAAAARARCGPATRCMQGVEAVSKEVEDPMGHELRRVITEARLGRESRKRSTPWPSAWTAPTSPGRSWPSGSSGRSAATCPNCC